MNYTVKTKIGRLRLLALLEGVSLLILVFVAVPLKYLFADPSLSTNLGPIHGALFLFFVFNTMQVGIEENWKFKETTWKVIISCFIPFGTFYIDYKVLRKYNI